jgi:MFS family permease
MSVRDEVKMIVHNSVEHGLKNRPVRLFMLAAPFASGIGIWVFYAFQPYLLELFGDPDAVYLSGVAAALFSVAQIIGGSLVGRIRKFFPTRTSLIATEVALGAVALVVTGVAGWM